MTKREKGLKQRKSSRFRIARFPPQLDSFFFPVGLHWLGMVRDLNSDISHGFEHIILAILDHTYMKPCGISNFLPRHPGVGLVLSIHFRR